jgi:uncharacterized protein (TIGR03435 family)
LLYLPSIKLGAMLLMASVEYVNRPVQDFIGLQKDYDFTLAFEADQRMVAGDTDSACSGSDPNIFTALQEQLGLKLEPRKASVEILVIDRTDAFRGKTDRQWR